MKSVLSFRMHTSLTQVKAYGNDRYSFKIEFDRFNSSNTYYGLDKLCLNNIIQDNTHMKDLSSIMPFCAVLLFTTLLSTCFSKRAFACASAVESAQESTTI